MTHIDLFSGIGGFAYAVDQVWDNAEHIFCEIDPFCQKVLRKHWKESEIYGDIRQFTSDTECQRLLRMGQKENNVKEWKVDENGQKRSELGCINSRCNGEYFILTGGFPCQPFSQAGKRKGTSDNRYLWKEMLRVIQLTQPKWVIAENVRGILTIEQGMVFEQVCLDLEGEGYEVQPFIIPAVAINAPHRRDRVWFFGNSNTRRSIGRDENRADKIGEMASLKHQRNISNAPDTDTAGQQNRNRERGGQPTPQGERKCCSIRQGEFHGEWNKNWLEVATELCRVDDGISEGLDFSGYTKARHRVERLKSLGNAIVPQVVIEIMRAIKENER